MAAPLLLTFDDCISHLVDLHSGGALGQNQREFRAAVQEAYREVMFARDWSYFKVHTLIPTVAAYSTGTVVFDLTGGANERQLTLTSGTWPTWALYGTVRIDSVNYQVAERVSDTILTLDPLVSPVADIASTTYTIFRSHYSMPVDFIKAYDLHPEDQSYAAEYLPPEELLSLERNDSSSGSTIFWSLIRSQDLLATWALWIWPYPTSAVTLDLFYQCSARPLYYTGFETDSTAGTISVTAATASVTGASTAFAEGHIGSVLRIAPSTVAPTGLGGLTPYTEQKIITAVTAAGTATVDSNWVSTASGKAYRISDPMDLAPDMLNALLRCAEFHLALRKGTKGLERYERAYAQARIRAAENDSRIVIPRYVGYAPGSWPRRLIDHPYVAPV